MTDSDAHNGESKAHATCWVDGCVGRGHVDDCRLSHLALGPAITLAEARKQGCAFVGLEALRGAGEYEHHDAQCEAEYVVPAGGYTPCGCERRRAKAKRLAAKPAVYIPSAHARDMPPLPRKRGEVR